MNGDNITGIIISFAFLGVVAIFAMAIVGMVYIDYLDASDFHCPDMTQFVAWNNETKSFDICVIN